MKTASRKPITRQANTNSKPYTARLCSESIQRSLSNRRWYWARPMKCRDGKVRDAVIDIPSVQTAAPI